MNYTQTFEEFSKSVTTTDLALYAGVGIVVWILFKNKLGPVKTLLEPVLSQVKNLVTSNKKDVVVATVAKKESDDIFFQLVSSWKQTRNLAVLSGCEEAVKVADQMFPHLSPTSCSKENHNAV